MKYTLTFPAPCPTQRQWIPQLFDRVLETQGLFENHWLPVLAASLIRRGNTQTWLGKLHISFIFGTKMLTFSGSRVRNDSWNEDEDSHGWQASVQRTECYYTPTYHPLTPSLLVLLLLLLLPSSSQGIVTSRLPVCTFHTLPSGTYAAFCITVNETKLHIEGIKINRFFNGRGELHNISLIRSLTSWCGSGGLLPFSMDFFLSPSCSFSCILYTLFVYFSCIF